MVVPSSGAPGGATALRSVFTLLNSAVGAGVLSLPFAFRAAGWAGCLACTLAVATIEGFTLYVLARYAEFSGSTTYSDLVRKMLGKKASALMSVVLIIYSYGSATAYLIILGDCFQPILDSAFGQMWWTGRDVVIPAMATAFMLPLCFPRTLDAIAGFSTVTFYALIAVVGAVVYRSVQAVQAPDYDWGAVKAFRPPLDMLDALPILAFGFQCHTNVVAVFMELEEEPDLLLSSATNLVAMVAGGGGSACPSRPPSPEKHDPLAAAAARIMGEPADSAGGSPPAGASEAAAAAVVTNPPAEATAAAEAGVPAAGEAPEPARVVLLRNPPRRFVRPPGPGRSTKLLGMVQIVCTAIGLTAAFYSLVGFFGYLQFPTTAHSNILLNYANDDKLMRVARVLVGIIQIIHYPVNHFPARNATRDLLAQLTGHPLSGTAFNVAEVFTFFGATLGLSLAIKDLGSVFKVIGGTCGAFFIFGMPGAFCLQYAYNKHLNVREGLQQPLLDAEPGVSAAALEDGGLARLPQQGKPASHHLLASKLWWAGLALLALAVGLIAMTVYTLIAPPI